MSKAKAPSTDWVWIEGYHRTGKVWLPLYNFRPDRRHIAKATLVALLGAQPGSKLDNDHLDYDDFRLQ